LKLIFRVFFRGYLLIFLYGCVFVGSTDCFDAQTHEQDAAKSILTQSSWEENGKPEQSASDEWGAFGGNLQ